MFDIIKGVRARTRPDFQLGLRLSPERFGMKLAEQREVARQALAAGDLDFLDMSLWDAFKAPAEAELSSRPLMDWFTDLPRGETRVGVAGKIYTAEDCRRAMEHGADFVLVGKAAILHHDFPEKVLADPDFRPVATPVSREYLAGERLGPDFIDYMKNFGMVAQTEPTEA